MSVAEDSPSAVRRKALKEADVANQLRVLGSCPLSKYMDIADRLFDHFQAAVDGRRLDEAYVFGLRFANLCLSGLPQHPEWKRENNAKGRKRLTSQVGDVLCSMDVIKQRMDAEELMKVKAELIAKKEEENRKKEAEQRQKNHLDEERQREQRIRDALEEERAQFHAEQRSQQEERVKKTVLIGNKKQKVTKKKDIQKSAMAKLKAMKSNMSQKEQHATVTSEGEKAIVAKEIPGSAKKAMKSNTSQKKQHVKVTSVGEKGIVGKEMPGSAKTSKKEPKIAKAKAKEGKNTEILVQAKKKASGPKAKDEKAKSSSPLSTKPSKIKENAPIVLSHSKTKEEDTVTKKVPQSISEQDARGKRLERKSSLEKNEQKATTQPEERRKTEAKNNNFKTAIAVPVEREQHEDIPLSETISTKSATKPMKTNASLSSSVMSNIVKPKNYIKSKLEAAKLSMSSSGILPSRKTSKNNLVNNAIATPGDTEDTYVAPQHTPRSQKEKATIDKLKRTISIQEDRIEYIEGKQIPSLLDAAKTLLKEDNRKEALKCLAHKKRLERQVDTTKAAVFNMETQMFMLESAIEDRYVNKALQEAATAIAGFQKNIGDPKAIVLDLTNMSESLPELDLGDSTDDELMEELEEWLSPEDKRKARENSNSYAIDDEISLLSMPSFLPTAPAATPTPTTPSVTRILNAALSE